MHPVLAAAHQGADALQSLYYAGGALGLVLALAGIAFKTRAWLRRRVHRWDRLEEVLGDPDAVPPRPGVLERMDDLSQRVGEHTALLDGLGKLAAELVPNHGSSYRDEYRRDRDYQREVNAAIAAKLGIVLPAAPDHVGG